MEKPEIMITLTEVKSRGFNDKLIAKLLPEPLLKDNPYYKKAAKMKLYKESDVEKAMETEEFQSYQMVRVKRQESAQKGIETKRKKLLKDVNSDIKEINIERISIGELRTLAIRERDDYYFEHRNKYEGYSAYGADDATVTRWMVNFVRHHLTDYEDKLWKIYKRVGKDEGYFIIRNNILLKIAEVYPELAEECKNQMYYTESEHFASEEAVPEGRNEQKEG